jgi:ribulose-phosphate 3-epimerase
MVVRQNPHCEIMVDGNVSFEYAPQMVAAGADILVAGSSSVFKDGLTITQGTEKLRKAICSNRG